MYRLWVYNAEIFCGLWTPIRTSDLTAEAKFKKGVFLEHPNTHAHTHTHTSLSLNCLRRQDVSHLKGKLASRKSQKSISICLLT